MARQCDYTCGCQSCRSCGACGRQSAHYPSCKLHGYDMTTGAPTGTENRDPAPPPVAMPSFCRHNVRIESCQYCTPQTTRPTDEELRNFRAVLAFLPENHLRGARTRYERMVDLLERILADDGTRLRPSLIVEARELTKPPEQT